ncbi:hypothetical protein TTHERM_00787300 (macronuclear) [Tetrahymena thermophila SB210]|uniref:Uncharacterized protein n=1 Tax=Tetrahymena thermophila (strain SB210) TaxID=312017 RepID=Q23ZD3_TETTS|nr:hypothetical protein TTHERM_00787300 [Tetrahymena thermophila SB210]EAS01924.2 hypothetical protein TTHERM_00787300 [Tetrahymena thermophila SB210]|eukprot:XP_001022169.2 hypothetical protein TTHERM_00787300 [Tetrahymena thermophila SB210]
MEGGGMNNYKGVMLCSRPNEPVKIAVEKPFCSRVEASQQLGLNPVKKEFAVPLKKKKKVNEALQRHKDWLEIYKLKMNLKKEDEDEMKKRDDEKFVKVKEIAAKDRERTKKMKADFEHVNQNINKILGDENPQSPKHKVARLTEKNLKKLEEQNQNEDMYKPADSGKKEVKKPSKKDTKPKWAYTEKQLEEDEDKECDDLLDFVNNLDYDQYINDLEVQSMVKAIKNRIHELQDKENWKENAIHDIKIKKKKQNEQKADQNDDVRSNATSVLSDARSHQSERSQQSIQSLKDKLNEQKKGKNEWDGISQTETKHKATLEERIAKHVADEVLRNYKHLGAVHSNQSIRKLLEREAQQYINKGNVDGPVISVVKENTLRKNEIDPNNLPYLHRNPAI